MKGSIKLKLDSIVKGLKGKGSLKDLLNSGAKKTDQQEKPAHKLSQDMDSEEQR